MIQFNLLPDIKLQYIKAQRTKQLVLLVSFVVSGVALGIMILLLITVQVVQRASLSNANDDIKKYSAQLKAIPDLDKILTVQNQLNTLTGLHDSKPVVSRIFKYISQLTPTNVSISSLTTDYTASTITVTGEADSLDTVNVYVDTLKSTSFKVGDEDTAAFKNVVLSSFGRDAKGATYTVTMSFDPDIFNSANDVQLTVPNIATSPQQQLFQKKAGQ